MGDSEVLSSFPRRLEESFSPVALPPQARPRSPQPRPLGLRGGQRLAQGLSLASDVNKHCRVSAACRHLLGRASTLSGRVRVGPDGQTVGRGAGRASRGRRNAGGSGRQLLVLGAVPRAREVDSLVLRPWPVRKRSSHVVLAS